MRNVTAVLPDLDDSRAKITRIFVRRAGAGQGNSARKARFRPPAQLALRAARRFAAPILPARLRFPPPARPAAGFFADAFAAGAPAAAALRRRASIRSTTLVDGAGLAASIGRPSSLASTSSASAAS